LLYQIFRRAAATTAGLVLAASAAVALASVASAASASTSVPRRVVLYYHFVNFNADLCLGIAGGSTNNGAGAVIWNCIDPHQDQSWSATLQNAQHYNIFENLDRKCLGILGGSRAQGARAVAWSCNNHADQQWKVRVISGPPNVYEFVNRNSGLCLGVRGASRSLGAAVVQWRCNGHADQHWFAQR
jgi:hypothetical protein